MLQTTNYNLKKIELTDSPPDITVINPNWDSIDAEMKSLRELNNSLATNKADLVNGKIPSIQLPNIEVPVQSVNSKTGAVVLTKTDIGLGNVDNSVDSAKAVLSATKLATPRAINGVNFDGTANITIADGTKAPTSHASTGTGYGLGTPANYGHVKTINDLTQASHIDGTSLSAYQGNILKDLIDTKNPTPIYATGVILAQSAMVDLVSFNGSLGYKNIFVTGQYFAILQIDILNGVVSGLYNRGRDYTYAKNIVLNTTNQQITDSGSSPAPQYFYMRKVGSIIYISATGNQYSNSSTYNTNYVISVV